MDDDGVTGKDVIKIICCVIAIVAIIIYAVVICSEMNMSVCHVTVYHSENPVTEVHRNVTEMYTDNTTITIKTKAYKVIYSGMPIKIVVTKEKDSGKQSQ